MSQVILEVPWLTFVFLHSAKKRMKEEEMDKKRKERDIYWDLPESTINCLLISMTNWP